MQFNLDGVEFKRVRIGYFPYTTGIDRCGNECLMVVSYDRLASGCNPYYWRAETHNRYGHEFSSRAEAETVAKNAAGSWSVNSVDLTKMKIASIMFKEHHEAKILLMDEK